MAAPFFTELSIVIAVGAIISLVMRLIRQPLVIGYILTGLVVGPALLNISHSEETFEVFASIGVALLLFIIGLGLNPRVIKEVGRVAALIALTQMFITTTLGFFASRAFGFTKTESLIIGIGLAFSSTIIILKLLSDKKEITRLHGKIVVGAILIEDIIATLALILVTARSENSFSAFEFIELGIKGILLGIPIVLISTLVLPRMQKIIAGSQEFLFLFAIGWGFGIATLFEYFGFSIEIGALFAGVALASLPYSQEISARLRPLRDFFLIVFFIVLGTRLELDGLSDALPIVITLVLIVILFKPLLIMVTMGLQGYTKSTSFKAGTALSQISEFSLVLAVLATQQGIIGPEILNIMTLVAIITIASSAYLITYNNELFNLFEAKLSLFERRKTKEENKRTKHYDMVLFGYNKGGYEFVKTMQKMNKKYVVVDYDPDVIDSLEKKGISFIYGDVTDIEMLEELNMDHAKLVVSTIGDHPTNLFLVRWLEKINPHAVFVCSADSANQAESLYEEGAAYVMLPHYVGSEQIGSFIKKNGFNKSEFRKFREKHLQHLQTSNIS
jgi:Kef-type K+ transport system membrane component KefB